MTGREIEKEIRDGRKADQPFIKWCRKENDFVDYELVNSFLASVGSGDEFASYELLTMDQMWNVLKEFDPKGVSRGEKGGEEVIFWEQTLADGTTKNRACPYTPDSLISVFDAVTKGNPVD
ncbi:hypothetical protein GeomeDRAFT_2738 [Geobacter metallireducens RCH3]|uniref:Uncharacterized protein n=1 Tax=Geobacter metallireducens (strain ATCC 53774 / DSM 7210 / GS-15) TaxID=269799 RepID=Q39ZG2_GEOMG|nr:hypothetical protein [Geobacter metallireducens]ABB30362.1 hypothetical protein Gmet_0113 [Geobacter metallireducens GS-15]EHP85027.1 hypothetical protein GeomeDRAFT_2738 [Geobacter metallireducens RCH3]